MDADTALPFGTRAASLERVLQCNIFQYRLFLRPRLAVLRSCSRYLEIFFWRASSSIPLVPLLDRDSQSRSMDTWDETFLGRIFCIRKGRQQFQSGREWPMLEAYIREDAKDEEEESLIGHHNDQDALRRSTPFNIALYVTSTSILICSIVFYLLMYFHAPSDSACERMNWAWSRTLHRIIYIEISKAMQVP